MLKFKVNIDNCWYLVSLHEIDYGFWKGEIKKDTRRNLKDIQILNFRKPNLWLGNLEKFMQFSINDLYDNPNWWCLHSHTRKSLLGQLIKGDAYARRSACEFLVALNILRKEKQIYLPRKAVFYADRLISLRNFIYIETGRQIIEEKLSKFFNQEVG